MGRGSNFTFRVDITDSYDPRVTGRVAQKGTVFRYIPAVGDPELLIKADDTTATNWISLSGGGALPITTAEAASTGNINLAAAPAAIDTIGLNNGDLVLVKNQAAPAENGVYVYNGVGNAMTRDPDWAAAADFVPGRQVFINQGATNADSMWADADYVTTLGVTPISFVRISQVTVVGDPNTLAFFDAAGNLTDNTDAQFDETNNSMAFGSRNSGAGVFTSSARGSLVRGNADSGGLIAASQTGTSAHGEALNGANITAGAIGSEASGQADGAGATIIADGIGSKAQGSTDNDGYIGASGRASFVSAHLSGGLNSASAGSFTYGCLIFGRAATNSNLNFVPIGPGQTVSGSAIIGYANDGSISCAGSGDLVGGYVDLASNISSSGSIGTNRGRIVWGYATNGGLLSTSQAGCFVAGYADAGSLAANGDGSSAMGRVSSGGSMNASSTGDCVRGYALNGGIINASGTGSFAWGHSDGGTILADAEGAEANGYAEAGSTIQANAAGAKAFGAAFDSGSTINAVSQGSLAFGRIDNGGLIQSGGRGSIAAGYIDSATISNGGNGDIVGGYADTGATITSTGGGGTNRGRIVWGYSANGGSLTTNRSGTFVHGTTNNSTINCSGIGATAAGYALDTSTITASGFGSHTHGYANAGSQIICGANGGHAFGFSDGGSSISNNGHGSLIFGHTISGFVIQNNVAALGSLVFGNPLTGSIVNSGRGAFVFGDFVSNSGQLATVFGLGHINSSFGALVLGQYSTPDAETNNAWVATDCLIKAGNGTGVGTEANAWRLDKDGKLTEAGALRTPVRLVTGSDNISERTDRVIICNDIAAGANTLTLPAGEEGLTFKFGAAATNTGTFALAPTGGDLIDGNVPVNIAGVATVIFTSGTWYSIG